MSDIEPVKKAEPAAPLPKKARPPLFTILAAMILAGGLSLAGRSVWSLGDYENWTGWLWNLALGFLGAHAGWGLLWGRVSAKILVHVVATFGAGLLANGVNWQMFKLPLTGWSLDLLLTKDGTPLRVFILLYTLLALALAVISHFPQVRERCTDRSSLGTWIPNATSFIASFCIMVLELVVGRIIARYLGSSLYTWTAAIGIILAGMTVGNYVGGRLSDRFRPAAALAALFLLASLACLLIFPLNNLVGGLGAWGAGSEDVSWPARIFLHVFLVFFVPALLLGTIGPVVAKMALDASRHVGRTVGNVYAWGALGGIAGTFATGLYFLAEFPVTSIVLNVSGALGLLGVLYSIVPFVWANLKPRGVLL